MTAVDALVPVLPVIVLFGVGALLARAGILGPATTDPLRRLVLTVTLPAALFLTFLHVTVDPGYLLIVVPVFAACVAMVAVAPRLTRALRVPSPYAPSLLAGFEAGMLGYAIYGAVFGQDALWRFAIVDIGQVLFVFFVLTAWVERRVSGVRPGATAAAASLVRTPVILAIIAGIGAGAAGLGPPLEGSAPTRAILDALGLLGAMTTPLIALVIGATIRLRPGALGRPARLVLARLAVWVALAVAFNAVVIRGVLGLDPLFEAAVLTMAILPAPFVIPLYLREERVAAHERDEVLNTLALGTLATLLLLPLVALASVR